MVQSATGAQARFRMKKEGTYGTAPAGDYWSMPFQPPMTLGKQQNLIDDPLLGQGRDRLDPTKGAIDVNGDATVPVDARYFGIWLAMLLGAPVTTGAGPYTHVFDSGADSLPSYAIEIAHPSAGRFEMFTGVMANTLALNFTREGQASATVGLIGQDSAPDDASNAGTPGSLALNRFSQFNASLKKDAAAITSILSASMTYSNGLEGIPVITDNGLIGGIDAGIAGASGEITARLTDDTSMLDAADAGDPVALDLGYVISDSLKLILAFPRVFLNVPKPTINGPGGIDVPFAWQAANDPNAGYLMRATLVNDYAGTAYT